MGSLLYSASLLRLHQCSRLTQCSLQNCFGRQSQNCVSSWKSFAPTFRDKKFCRFYHGPLHAQRFSKAKASFPGAASFGRILLRTVNRKLHTSTPKPAAQNSNSVVSRVPQKTELRRLFVLAKPEKWKLLVATGCLLVSSAVVMAVPFGTGRIIDIIYANDDHSEMMGRLKQFCTLLSAVFLFGAVANFGRVYLMTTAGNRIIKRLREAVFSSIVRQEMAFFDKNKTGELINRLSTDATIVGRSVTANMSDGLRSVAQIVGGISMMVYMSPKLAGVALCIVPPLILAGRYYGRYVQRITKQVQDALADSTQVAEERLSNMRTVRAFGQEGRELEAYSSQVDRVLRLSYKEAAAQGVFWSFTGLSGNFMILSVFFYGGLLMNESQITVGELSSFMLYAAFTGMAIGGLTSFYGELMRGIGASSRLFHLTDITPSIPLQDGLTLPHALQGDIEFRDVTFSYPARADIPVLQSLNLVIPHGHVLAVVGSSGSGKSTLASLLLRYYDPDHGVIAIDNTDIREFSPQWLRSNMGIVSQEPTLFSCSVAENIAYGAVDPSTVSPGQIERAARMANALHFIQGFSDRFDTLVGERGIMLSGGQKQRIAIARAIIKDPTILLLDEATSALDSQSEYLVQEALERVMRGRTVITIAHRLSTIKHAHQIALLHQGAVSELGSYSQLMEIPEGRFRQLVERQTIQR